MAMTSVVDSAGIQQAMLVVVPPGVVPGQLLQLDTPQGPVQFPVPPGCTPGTQLQVPMAMHTAGAPVASAPPASLPAPGDPMGMADPSGQPAGPASTPTLQLVVEKEDLVRLGKRTNESYPGRNGYHAEIPVTGGSGTQIGVLRLHTTNVLTEPCTVQLVSPTGENLMSYEISGLSERWKTSSKAAVIQLQLSGHVYASCTNSMESLGGTMESTTSVTRMDGSGGTLVEAVDSGCGSTRCTWMILGVALFIFVIGIFFLCAAWAMPVTGRVRSLNGSAEYAPHDDARGTKTVNFVPDPKDKKRDSYTTYDAKTKVDALVGVMISAANTALCGTQDNGAPAAI